MTNLQVRRPIPNTAASATTVWALLVDGRSWPRWASGLDELVEDRRMAYDIGWLMPFVVPRIMQRLADDLAAYAVEVG